MPRPRKNPISPAAGGGTSSFSTWAESFGEALGRGVARGINAGLSGLSLGGGIAASASTTGARRRGRPPKVQTGGPVPADRMCKVPGCGREARSKGLCSAHYQAERRRILAKAAAKS